MRSPACWMMVLALVACPLLAASPNADPEAISTTSPESRPLQRLSHAGGRIVNGLRTVAFPNVAAILDSSTNSEFCTGTLIGCRTVITAAHCVCEDDGPACQGSNPPSRTDPSDMLVFFQHAGTFSVTSVKVHPSFEFGTGHDVALLTLGDMVEGIKPARINTTSRPANGSTGGIVGFGLTHSDLDDSGIKRQGLVKLSSCSVVPGSTHLCWQFANPVGTAGQDSNTCLGDSGGPLFVNFGSGNVIAGVTSGGTSGTCQTPDSSWDNDIFVDRSWVQNNAGADINNTTCGTLPQVEASGATVFFGDNTVSGAKPDERFSFPVATGTNLLRVALNGEDGSFLNPNDFDLYLRAGSQPTTAQFDCRSAADGTFEQCEVAAPSTGTWHILVHRFAGSGRFQVTASLFSGATASNDCVADDDTLCIDDQPGDQRWKIEISYDTTLGGGRSGMGQAIPLDSLGITRGGLFWFFSATNPELLIKVLNNCGNSGFYWVFWSATTSVGMTVTVTDTQTGRTKTYTNPDRNAAAPVGDTRAFSCP